MRNLPYWVFDARKLTTFVADCIEGRSTELIAEHLQMRPQTLRAAMLRVKHQVQDDLFSPEHRVLGERLWALYSARLGSRNNSEDSNLQELTDILNLKDQPS